MRTDDIVVVADSNAVRGKWSIGKVVEVHPGPTLVSKLAIYSQLRRLKKDSGFLFQNSMASQINSGVTSEKQNGGST